MRRNWAVLFLLVSLIVLAGPFPVRAQEGQSLLLFCDYPARVAELGETVTFNLTLRLTAAPPQTVYLDVKGLPEDWDVSFRGGGNVVRAVYVEPDKDASVSLRVVVPENVSGDTYRWTVIARGEGVSAEFPLELTVAAKLPPRLTLSVDLPTLRGAATTTFRYDATLKNEGDEETTVNLQATAPQGFLVSFKYLGQDVTSLPVGANESKRISIEARAYTQVPAGTYPIEVVAVGGESQASISLVAEVTGQPDLTIRTPDERLSTQVYTGRETPIQLLVQNNGSAPALNVELSASPPSGWSVRFAPERIPEIPAGQQVEITMHIKPADKAVAGDYMLTVRARPQDGGYESAEFRITVLTSTLWGVAGIALIAIAVLVVAWAVMRFGRR
ncbi:MAG: NEW3 domain-containing protein [Anaerolineae bacterium]|nr:NEW3 domain-containing protein [Anaerolineae bacterium]MDW8068011.1 NEW3 domain-containing protein [Anaerolineae bacterium]